MQVFKSFYKILWKNRASLILYFAIFFALTIVFTNTAKENNTAPTSFSTEKISVAIVDEDKTDASKAMCEFVKKECDAKIVDPMTNKQMQDAVYYRDYEYFLTIPKGYEDKLKDKQKPELIDVKVPDSFTGSFVDMKLNTYENILMTYLKSDLSLSEALDKTQDAAKVSSDVQIKTDSNSNGEHPGYFYYFSYFAYIIVVVLILGIGLIMSQFNKKDLERRNKVSAMPGRSFNAQIFAGCATFALAVWAIMNIIGFFICQSGKGYYDNLPYILVNSLAITLVAASLSFLLGNLLKTSSAINGAGNTFSLGFAFLGGIFVPIEFMNESVLRISNFIPTYWYTKALTISIDENMAKSANQIDFWKFLGIQMIFAVAFFTIALVIRKAKTKE